MNNRYISNNGKTLKRITKTRAKTLYSQGKKVLFVPCKLNPFNMWGLGIWENNQLDGQFETFEKLVNAYEFYNCSSETGKYIAFYIEQ